MFYILMEYFLPLLERIIKGFLPIKKLDFIGLKLYILTNEFFETLYFSLFFKKIMKNFLSML